jgi:hypothetical protein
MGHSRKSQPAEHEVRPHANFFEPGLRITISHAGRLEIKEIARRQSGFLSLPRAALLSVRHSPRLHCGSIEKSAVPTDPRASPRDRKIILK